MSDLIFCLDSGTTAVKAAAFTADGKLVALCETPNTALKRKGVRAEQDMAQTRHAAWDTLRRCIDQAHGKPRGLIVTGQGEGLWPLDRMGEPVGDALTWLDGRAVGLLDTLDHGGILDTVAGLTGARPTTASSSIQLLWMQEREPERFERIQHVLRAKEWLFFGLTGELLTEPSTAMLTWGDWRLQQLTAAVEEQLGLKRGLGLLPPLSSLSQSVRPLCASAASATGLPEGLPVMLGPSDVQATAIGLGVGVLDGVTSASIFGTSAIHVAYFPNIASAPQKPKGAMLQPFVEAPACLFMNAGFNGTTSFRHIQALVGGEGPQARRALSGVLLHPFFEPGGERAPVTDVHATASLFGLNSRTSTGHIAWAAREALAFNARMSHDMMSPKLGPNPGPVAFGGGLAADDAFASLLATVLDRPVLRPASPHAGLIGIGLIAAQQLSQTPLRELAAVWLAGQDRLVLPQPGPQADFFQRKYALYTRLLERMAPFWPEISALHAEAEQLENQQGIIG